MEAVLPDNETMYQALLNKDSQFEGVFFVGVKTTGIFCRPTCHARKPKRENVEFFNNVRQALAHGYRPCKLCRPVKLAGTPPEWLQPLLDEIEAAPLNRIKDSDLRQRGLKPEKVRRWFKANHGMTFQAYLRSIRINHAFGRIQYGETVTDNAFNAGYQSLSGFSDSFKKVTGISPNKSANHQIINITRILTPLGPMLAGAARDGICLLEFSDRRMLETQFSRLRKWFDAELVPGNSPYFESLSQQLEAYFKGELKDFDLPIAAPGTDFQKEVWKALLKIPYGETRSYKQIAALIQRPTAVRAVARANGDNRLAILIPCHRVIGDNGKLTGYGGGLWRKQYLLELEGAIKSDHQQMQLFN
jgi:AraC family transcriptional regulator of adaptative response/methylated-DNA-[protein]-cysteine methyltransferase